MTRPSPLSLVSILLTALLLQACGPAVVGGAAVGTATLIHDRRTSGTVVDDQRIEFEAASAIDAAADLKDKVRVSATSYNRVLLLTGQAPNAALRARIEALVRPIQGVRRVVNAITLGPPAELSEISHDTWITTKVKTALTKIDLPDFDPLRVKVVTEQGVVYLMGLVTREEARAVVEKVRYVDGVKKVVKIFEYIEPKTP